MDSLVAEAELMSIGSVLIGLQASDADGRDVAVVRFSAFANVDTTADAEAQSAAQDGFWIEDQPKSPQECGLPVCPFVSLLMCEWARTRWS
jgi:hypothetical protein